MSKKDEPGGKGRAYHLIRRAFAAAEGGDRYAHDEAWALFEAEGYTTTHAIRKRTRFILRVAERNNAREEARESS